MIFRFIDQHKDLWPVRLLCETLEVSAAGYYAWCKRPASAKQQRREALVTEIRSIHAEVKAQYRLRSHKSQPFDTLSFARTKVSRRLGQKWTLNCACCLPTSRAGFLIA